MNPIFCDSILIKKLKKGSFNINRKHAVVLDLGIIVLYN